MTTAGNETAVAEAAINEKKQNCWKATKKLSIRQTDDVKNFFPMLILLLRSTSDGCSFIPLFYNLTSSMTE